MLKFITDRKNVTRAEVETYYRNGIKDLVSQLVDEQFADLGRNISVGVLTEIKREITDFMLAPNRATYTALLQASRRYAGYGAIVLGRTMGEINHDIYAALADYVILGQ